MSAQAVSIDQPLNGATPPGASLSEKTVCISITFGSLGNSRKVNTSQIEVQADKALIRVSKKLLDSPELKAIAKHDGDTRDKINQYAVPSFFRAGIYRVSLQAIEPVEAALKAAAVTRKGLVEAFLAAYEGKVADAQERLRDLFNPLDYPDVEQVRSLFTLKWRWISLATPTQLKEIKASFFQDAVAQAAADGADAAEQIRAMLRLQLKGFVDHLHEVLAPADGGPPKRFQKSTVTNLTNFLDTFDLKNVVDDTQMAQIVGHAKAILSGVDAEAIRSDENVREYTTRGFSLLKQCLDTLAEDAGSRRIVLDSEEDV